MYTFVHSHHWCTHPHHHTHLTRPARSGVLVLLDGCVVYVVNLLATRVSWLDAMVGKDSRSLFEVSHPWISDAQISEQLSLLNWFGVVAVKRNVL